MINYILILIYSIFYCCILLLLLCPSNRNNYFYILFLYTISIYYFYILFLYIISIYSSVYSPTIFVFPYILTHATVTCSDISVLLYIYIYVFIYLFIFYLFIYLSFIYPLLILCNTPVLLVDNSIYVCYSLTIINLLTTFPASTSYTIVYQFIVFTHGNSMYVGMHL